MHKYLLTTYRLTYQFPPPKKKKKNHEKLSILQNATYM